ncbi:hypothetical protein B0H16DRAFT_1894673 [Mycena metata]|uniref:Uncharacterized protein n=1 Tax=Mycena metata TaxID=1033252 RepID=A0AAD7HT22_9AGAR|nr:hypothetical protein B0H16DRAFT_1894673 [Mycena metata]
MAQSVSVHIQELCELIVGFLQDSRADLESCALVSPAFTLPAQRHLFRDIDITLVGELPDRFFTILAAAPHILPLVRRIRTYFREDVLTQLCDLHFPNLRELSFTGNTSSVSFIFTRNTSSAGLKSAATLVGLPSIRSVTLDDYYFISADVNELFERCTSPLDSLILDTGTIADNAEPTAPSRRIKLNRLVIRDRWDTWMWLLHPMSPFDLTAIHELDYNSSNLFSPPATLLNSSRRTLNKLRITEEAYDGVLPLCIAVADLPALTHLVVTVPAHLKWEVMTCPLLRSDSVVLITFAMHRNIHSDHSTARLGVLRSNMSAQAFPKLQTVELAVPAHFFGAGIGWQEVQERVRAAMVGWDMYDKLNVTGLSALAARI